MQEKVQRQIITFDVVPKPAISSVAVFGHHHPAYITRIVYFAISTPPVAPRAYDSWLDHVVFFWDLKLHTFLMSP